MTLPPMNILLVEDNPGDVALAQEAFGRAGVAYRLRVASDGVEALDMLRSAGQAGGDVPDLIILDLNLPRKGGREVVAELERDDRLRRIPLVVFSGSSQDRDVVADCKMDACIYMVKPIDFAVYVSQVRQIEEFWRTAWGKTQNQEPDAIR